MDYLMNFYTGGVALFWLAVAWGSFKRRKEDRWKLDPQSPVLPDLPPLRVVIPARNEAGHIGPCLRSVLASDHPHLRITVFDDGSTDGTGEIAQSLGADVQTGADAIPPDWRGKTWALQRATRSITEEWVLFLDADVRVEPTALSRAHSYAIAEKVDFLSGFGRLVMESFWEKVIQPTMGGIILFGNPTEKINDDAEQEKVVANGQFILVRREVYEELGAHTPVKDLIIEDVGLARHFRKNGRKMRVLMMRDLFGCRMYSNLREIWLGWTKNFYVGLRRKPGAAALLVGFLGVYVVGPTVFLALSPWLGALPMALGLWLLVQGVRLGLDLRMGQEPLYGLLQPLGAVMAMGIVGDSMRRAATGTLSWKGRHYAG